MLLRWLYTLSEYLGHGQDAQLRRRRRVPDSPRPHHGARYVQQDAITRLHNSKRRSMTVATRIFLTQGLLSYSFHRSRRCYFGQKRARQAGTLGQYLRVCSNIFSLDLRRVSRCRFAHSSVRALEYPSYDRKYALAYSSRWNANCSPTARQLLPTAAYHWPERRHGEDKEQLRLCFLVLLLQATQSLLRLIMSAV